MALREFIDEHGRRWRVWDIVPNQLQPATRFEDYMQGFVDGWLAFESLDGTERARLTPVPIDWAQRSEDELRGLLARAERSGPRARPFSASADDSSRAEASSLPESRSAGGEWSGSWSAFPIERGFSAPLGTIRTFRYPGGRFWSVYEQVVELPTPGTVPALRPRVVLRFTSGMRSLDLIAWPEEWHTHSDEGLAELLWRAFPRGASDPPPGTPRRRRSDRAALA